MANKGPSVPQIIKLLDWQDDTDYCHGAACALHGLEKFCKAPWEEETAQHAMRLVIDAANICSKCLPSRILVNMLWKCIKHQIKSLSSRHKTVLSTMKGRYHAKLTTVWSLLCYISTMIKGMFAWLLCTKNRKAFPLNLWKVLHTMWK